MPSKSEAQARLMRAVAHGWKPMAFKGPSVAVAEEFVREDEKRGRRKLPTRVSPGAAAVRALRGGGRASG